MFERGLDRFASPGAALDIGCDGGKWSKRLWEAGWKVTGIDIREEAIELCRRRLPQGTFHVVSPEATVYPVPENSVDYLICIQVPVAHNAWFMREAYRILRPNGLLIFHTFNRFSYRYLLSLARSIAEKREEQTYRSTYHQVRRLYVQQGFKVVEEYGHAWFPWYRHSDSPMIDWFTAVESKMRMHRLTTIAPWVITAVTK